MHVGPARPDSVDEQQPSWMLVTNVPMNNQPKIRPVL
jgi:hypothetical protein